MRSEGRGMLEESQIISKRINEGRHAYVSEHDAKCDYYWEGEN